MQDLSRRMYIIKIEWMLFFLNNNGCLELETDKELINPVPQQHFSYFFICLILD